MSTKEKFENGLFVFLVIVFGLSVLIVIAAGDKKMPVVFVLIVVAAFFIALFGILQMLKNKK